MTKEKFEELFNDKNIVKFGTTGYCIFKDVEDITAIQVAFSHSGDSSELPPKKRIFLSAFPLNDLVKDFPEPYQIKNNQILILANADMHDYALAYHLTINPSESTIEVKLYEYPTVGEKFITQEEIDGLKIYY